MNEKQLPKDETLNLFPASQNRCTWDRVKPYVVVSDAFFYSIFRLLSRLRLLADGHLPEGDNGQFKPPNLDVKEILFDFDLYDFDPLFSQLALPKDKGGTGIEDNP